MTVCLDGNARHAIAHRTAEANKCRAKWKLEEAFNGGDGDNFTGKR